MSYKVVRDFTDLQDNNHVYRTGDSFPRDGVEVTQGRIEELSSNKNKLKQALIEKVDKGSKPAKTEPVEVEEEQVEVELEPPKEEKVEKKDNKKKKEK